MQIQDVVPLEVKLDAQAWCHFPDKGVTIEEQVKKLETLGHIILSVDKDGTDPDNNVPGVPGIKVMQVNQDEDRVYMCEHCRSYSKDKEKVVAHEVMCNYKPKEII